MRKSIQGFYYKLILVISKDFKFIVTGSDGNDNYLNDKQLQYIHILETETGEIIRSINHAHDDRITSLAIS